MRLVPDGFSLPGLQSRGRRPRLAACLAAMLAAGLAAAGCSAGGGGGAMQPVTVAAVPGIDNAPLFLAQRDGAFAAAGLKVTILRYRYVGQALAAIDSGRAQVAVGSYDDFLIQQATSPALRIIADGYDAAPGVMEVMTLPGSSVKTPADLAGKTVGTPYEAPPSTLLPAVPNRLAVTAAQSVLSSDGVNQNSITWDPIAPQDLVRALQGHLVDAILVTEPEIYQAQSLLGATELLDAASGATSGLPLSGYFALNAWVRGNLALAHKFRSALEQAQASAAMPGQVQNALAHYAGMPSQEARLVTVGTYPTSTNLTELQRVVTLLDGAGLLLQPVNVAEMLVR